MTRGVESTQERCTGGGAICGSRVSIGKGDAFLADSVDMGRFVIARALAGEIGVAEVVGIKEDDIGPFFLR